MSYSKLQPIYAALDGNQYNRAVKLCLQLPEPSLLSQALLAHAYAKSGQTLQSLIVLVNLLPADHFDELHMEAARAQLRHDNMDPAALSPPVSALSAAKPATNSKKGKKQKKKTTTSAALQHSDVQSIVPISKTRQDWVYLLDHPSTLPVDWDRLPPYDANFCDETLIRALSVTLRKSLPLTNFQLLLWTSNNNSNNARDAFLAGLAVLVAPHYATIAPQILKHMQSMALQMAKTEPMAVAWAAQACLWQLQYKNDYAASDNANQLLPRLAETLAYKSLQSLSASSFNSDSLVQTELFLLYLKTLDGQGKCQVKAQALDERLNSSYELVYPPRSTLLDLKAETLHSLGDYAGAIELLEQELLCVNPDNWSFWKRHMACSLAMNGNELDGLELTEQLADSKVNDGNYFLRGPWLALVDIAAQRLNRQPNNAAHATLLINRVKQYTTQFGGRSSCTFADLIPYLKYLLQQGPFALELLQWLKSIRKDPTSEDAKQRRSELRIYITVVQMTHKVLSVATNLRKEWMPDWVELLQVWKSFQAFDVVSVDDQKESRPADDLILSAVQQLLCRDEPGTVAVAASVLEAGIAYSPYNAHLKIAAIRVYSDLNAATRSYELFQSIFVKHIQYESCAYLILPVLRFGGMYREIICVCKELIRLQRIAVHDATDFAGRAMENGALSKADEFLRFQRERMNCSLTTLEAKGLILDAAPMLSTHKDSDSSLGSVHGIVGCELDFDRATQMIGEANDPLGAFSLLTLRRQDSDLTQQYSENRDFSVLYLEMLSRRQCASAEDIVCDSLYRSYTHNLLLRSTLCLKAAKGPKKGRVVPATDEIRQRCTSLLVLIDTALRDCIDSPEGVKGQHQLFTALIGLCRVLSGVSSGLFSDASDTDGDSLEMREEKATLVLSDVRTCFLQAKNGMVLLNESSTHLISRLLSENLISLFAVFRMCADTLDAFGWGKRKRRASHCASAMADVAYAFGDLINNMVLALSSLSVSTVSTGELSSKIVPDIIEDALYAGTLSVISESRRSTHNRLTRILLVIKASLEEFDVRE